MSEKRATYQDVLDAPEHMIAEIVGGELRLSPRPAVPHSAVITHLSFTLGPPFGMGQGGPGGWIILIEPELHLGDDIFVPDLCAWRRERLASLTDDAYISLAPDWVCEVLSHSTERLDRAEKTPAYFHHGVEYIWLLHPRRRILEALRRDPPTWRAIGTYTETDRVRIAPFDAIELDLATLWTNVARPTRASDAAFDHELGL